MLLTTLWSGEINKKSTMPFNNRILSQINIPHNSLFIAMFSLSIQDWEKKQKELGNKRPGHQSNIKSYTDENLFAVLSKWDYGILKSKESTSLLH